MVKIEHAGDSIKAEAVELVFVHPEPQVAEQESEYLVAAIVEQPAVP